MANQQAQLDAFMERADGWGEEIIAQIPASEIDRLLPNMGGVRLANDYYLEWPKFYYWQVTVELKHTGARTPNEVADDLEPWLAEQGWIRNTASERPPRQERFTRDYRREGYHLAIEVYTQLPPRAQSLNFAIVTPETRADG